MVDHSIHILAAARTPMGGLLGDLADLSAGALGAVAIRAALERAGGDAATVIDGVIMGNVIGAGQGQAPARQATLGAGLPQGVGATTLNKMCGSGMQAVMDAADRIAAGSARVMVAGGMESMSNAPYLVARTRSGLRLGHAEFKDAMFLDGLEDAYERGRLMGSFADRSARELHFSREAQDDFALASLERARRAIAEGDFAEEIVPVTLSGKSGETVVAIDEQPGKAKPDRVRSLKPAFIADGTVTAANSSSISDGAAALVLAAPDVALSAPIARIVGHAVHAQAPADFATAPGPAIAKLLDRVGWRVADVDLFEVNEAFAVVAMAAMSDLGIDHDRLNVNGGACALGHPIGASGARVLVTLIHALKRRELKRGVASLCIGGGEATAMAVELV